MNRSTHSWALSIALLCLACCQVEQAFASSFSVTPINVFLSSSVHSSMVTIHNQSTEPLRFQVTAFAWAQDPLGNPELSATEDILFFPALLAVPPGERRNVRIGTKVAVAATEKTYRIFVEELPAPEPATGATRRTEVHILTRMGIPVFLQPGALTVDARIEQLAVQHGIVTFALQNAGAVHFIPRRVRVEGLDATGDSRFAQEIESTYVLAAGTRRYQLALPESACRGTRALVVSAQLASTAVEARLELDDAACL